jgi:hypothetical protein
VKGRAPLVVTASSTARVRAVRFLVDGRRVGLDRNGGSAGLYTVTWKVAAHKGSHTLRAVVVDARGRTAAATRTVRVCR